ncbi:unnamed protein product [Caenorhabditis sp. 36 PRJEB53466]|nr:unnamed protein product [Caenorhabditis sp. 36 PRJEB53466]
MTNSSERQKSQLYKLKSSDDKIFPISADAIRQSWVLHSRARESPELSTLFVNQVVGDTLERLIKWCEEHKDDRPLTRDEERNPR